jgi:heat shock protein HslJ
MEATMIRPSKTLAAVLLIAVSLIALVGCSPAGSPLAGTQWRLTEWTLSSLTPTDFTITAKFANGQISGNSGVNTYSGPYKLGPGAAFSAGPLAGTKMAGPEPAMRAETAYLTLLGQAKLYKMADGKLTLYDKGRNESLIFEAASM